MSACPQCGRPVALQRATCLYCGAPLGDAAPVPAATPPPPETAAVASAAAAPLPAGPARGIVLLDVTAAAIAPAAIGAALGLTQLEAELLARRQVPLVHRILEERAAAAEAARLRAAGLHAEVIEERQVLPALLPQVARGGELRGATLFLELEQGLGSVALAAADLELVVRGPIAREYTALAVRRRVRSATLEPGYRFHLHRRGGATTMVPVEIDPATFVFPRSDRPWSSLLTLGGWIAALGLASECDDDSFRRETPALGPEEAARTDLGALLRGGGTASRRDGDGATIVDNLRQFRWHSGLRAAVARARATG